MNKEKLYQIVKTDMIKRHGEGGDECLGEPDEIIDFMDMAMNRVGYNNNFKSFTEWLIWLGLTDEDIMWVYSEINKVQ